MNKQDKQTDATTDEVVQLEKELGDVVGQITELQQVVHNSQVTIAELSQKSDSLRMKITSLQGATGNGNAAVMAYLAAQTKLMEARAQVHAKLQDSGVFEQLAMAKAPAINNAKAAK